MRTSGIRSRGRLRAIRVGAPALAVLLSALWLLPGEPARAAAGDGVALRADQPGIYLVQAGDTLWHIAGLFLEEPWRWPEIWEINPQLDDPHLIFPGDTIRLRWVDGEPRLTLRRGPEGSEAGASAGSARTERLRPRVRATPLGDAIPTIDVDAIRPLLRANRIVDEEAVQDAPYVLQGESGRILLGPGDRLYARGVGDRDIGTVLAVVRPAGRIRDPETGEVLGLEAVELGTVRLLDVDADIGTLGVTRADAEIRIGDRLLPVEQRRLAASLFPTAPEVELEGRMIHVLWGVEQIGPNSVVLIDLGRQDGLRRGDVLAVLRQGPLVRDRFTNEVLRMPPDRAGLLMVFRVFEATAYGLVLEADRPLSVSDRVISP